MDKTFGLPTLYWGLIIFAIGAIVLVIALLNIAKIKDREFEQKQRRQARLVTNENTSENTNN